jgi:hypothetical protein
MDRRATIIIAGSVVLVVGLIVGWAVMSSEQELSVPVSEISDAAAIQNSVQLSHLSIATSENFARQRIYVITATLKNLSPKPLRMAEVKMTFTDFDGKPIHEYSQKILTANQRTLSPGEEFRFELRQENLPRGWNYRVPVTEVTKLGY